MNYWWHSLWGTEHLPAFMKLKKLRWGSGISILSKAQSKADSKGFAWCYALPRITVISRMLSSFYLYTITHHLDLSPTLPMCKIFPLQRGTVSAPCTKFNNFSNHIPLLFQMGWGGRGCVQSKGQQNGSQGKNTLKRDLQHMFSDRICPWESKEGLQALLFQDTLSLCIACLQVSQLFCQCK